MNRPILRDDRHPAFEEHHDHDGWKVMLFGLACGPLVALALAYAMAAS